MAEYIDREAFKEEVRRLSMHYLNEWDTLGVLAAVDRIPAADVRPVVRGKWQWTETGNDDYEQYWVCSVCGEHNYYESNFCPNCGAKMEES